MLDLIFWTNISIIVTVAALIWLVIMYSRVKALEDRVAYWQERCERADNAATNLQLLLLRKAAASIDKVD